MEGIISKTEERIIFHSFSGLDISQLELKVDHFDQVHVLGPDNVIDGAPNFRQVESFLVKSPHIGHLRCLDFPYLAVPSLQKLGLKRFLKKCPKEVMRRL